MLKDLYLEKMKIEDKIYVELKQIKILPNDIQNNILTNYFYDRTDLSNDFKDKLRNLSNSLINLNKEIFKQS